MIRRQAAVARVGKRPHRALDGQEALDLQVDGVGVQLLAVPLGGTKEEQDPPALARRQELPAGGAAEVAQVGPSTAVVLEAEEAGSEVQLQGLSPRVGQGQLEPEGVGCA
jgi:hypothetical protein